MTLAHGGWFTHSIELLLMVLFGSLIIYAIFFVGRKR